MSKRIAVGLILACCLVAGTVGVRTALTKPVPSFLPRPAKDPVTAEEELLISGLESEKINIRAAAYRGIRRRHRALTERLLEIANQPKPIRAFSGNSCDLAIKILTEMGDRRVIAICIRDIEFSQGEDFTAISHLVGHPCAQALRDFGPSVTYEILRYLVQAHVEDVSDKAIDLYSWVIVETSSHLLGRHTEALEVVERSARRSSETHGKNIIRLRDRVREITKDRKPIE